MLSLILLPLSLIYVYIRAFSPFLQKRLHKTFAFLLVFAFAFSFPIGMSIMHVFGLKSLFIIRLTSFVFGIFAFTLLFLLMRDFIRLIAFATKMDKISNFTKSIKSVQLSIVSATLLAVIGIYSAIQVPDVREVAVTIDNLPEDLKGFKIVQITDTHIGGGFDGKWLTQVVNKINALEPDLIVGTGDIVDDRLVDVGDEADSLTRLSAPYGVYFISGNHEYYAGFVSWLEYFEKKLGLNFLVNESVVLEVGSAKLSVSGLPDIRNYRAENVEGRIYEKMLKNVPYDAVKIVLDHQPVSAKENARYGFDLQLSGHTHGGQVIFIKPLVAAANGGYVADLYDVGGMQLYVSRGTGLWGYASLRLFVPAEITLITLQ